MKKVFSFTLFACFVLTSFVSLSAQERSPVTEIYRVGVGDVLDIRLLNSPNNHSTLFTVMPAGAIDLPVAGGAIPRFGSNNRRNPSPHRQGIEATRG